MKKIATTLIAGSLLLGGVACEPTGDTSDKPTIVVKNKKRKKPRSKVTPVVEYTCYKNIAGKRVCRKK